MSHPTLEAALEVAGQAFDSLQQLERDLAAHQAVKAEIRLAAITRIMERPTVSGKPHSYTSAEALRDTDPTYASWKQAELARSQAKAHAEFILWAARQRVEYLSRTLPPTPEEWLNTARESVKSYGCIHGVPIDDECSQCDAGLAHG
jgi:hypothetical protein